MSFLSAQITADGCLLNWLRAVALVTPEAIQHGGLQKWPRGAAVARYRPQLLAGRHGGSTGWPGDCSVSTGTLLSPVQHRVMTMYWAVEM
jgi:hypothetical protein